ncbi:NADPH-dependent assimilatory sulfite reductase hemoprotein subunit [Alienimonas chondri]|uniref:Sulfite reductase [ferredoxin] n=1 Tax=Alienimonas chondri TaxID=2681879 RepID=A0ABX1VFX3_9PLAN|nr:NADPH-dependent assimilatory sulfite reductase hemoprotein subunit [Alienimonas chondri]NNJ26775.1 Sulfite reductase [ferredoxin] [Alienimonas chondri]
MADDTPQQHQGEQADAGPAVSELEHLKRGSEHLQGTLPTELANDSAKFTADALQLLKHHGSYQQDDRDVRKDKAIANAEDGRWYMMMVRTGVPGGRLTAEQLLAEIDLSEKHGNGTVRATSRQGLQVHGVLKSNIRETIREINRIKLSTFAACGDVGRNTMCCPEPSADPVRHAMQQDAERIAKLLRPRTSSYYNIWLRDANDPEGEKLDVTAHHPMNDLPEIPGADRDTNNDAVEPLYGTVYLPRKFKVGFALPEDNCVDVYSQDLGFLAVRDENDPDKLAGYNVLVGGGMGMTPAKKDTFPRLGDRMAFVTPEDVLAVAAAVVRVQRDHGERQNRKRARLKYLVHDRGLDWFREQVEADLGRKLDPPHAADVTDVDDHLGWREQGDGKWYLGLPVPDGRIADFAPDDPHGGGQWKSCLRELLTEYGSDVRITPLVGIVLCDFREDQKAAVGAILRKHKCQPAEELSLMRRNSMACVALPTCGLAVTESERVIGQVIQDIESRVAQYGLSAERISIHMTGCPNGCARPYTPDIGLVGKARNKYTLYLGGRVDGTRMAFLYEDMVALDKIAEVVSPALAYFKQAGRDVGQPGGETFGDFCARVGEKDLKRYAAELQGESDTLGGEIDTLTDDQLADLIDRFADDLSAEQLKSAVEEGRGRNTNGRLQKTLAAAEKRFAVTPSAEVAGV